MSIDTLARKNAFTKMLARNVLTVCYSLFPTQSLKITYRLRFGERLNLSNPQTFTEKIQWIRLYDHDQLKTQLSDKYMVRKWIEERIGSQYLIPLLGVWNSFDEIDFKKLPKKFVLKANHGSGWNIIVHDKSQFDVVDARKKCTKWLKTNYGKMCLEPQYVNIVPKLIAEQYIENDNGNLYDYKIHCFAGKATYIQYIGDRASHATKEVFYDREWNCMPFTYTYPKYDVPIPEPHNLKRLLELAETLAHGFPYVRVDFYVLNDGSFKFGEMTFTPAGGCDKWNPPEYNKILGDMIKLK